MKILFFIESLRSGGKERRLIELLLKLNKYSDVHFELVLTRRNIHYQIVHELNIPIHIIERKTFKKDPRLFFQFFKIVKQVRPDIIHVWGNLAAIYAIPSKVLFRIPMINNQIADAPSVLPNRILSYKLTFPFSDVLISNSKAGLLAYKPPREKSIVIYNGFDFKRLNNLQDKKKIRIKFNIQTKYVVGMVASFSDLKDYKTYVKAALMILDKNNDVTFLCVGSGDYSKYKKMVGDRYKNRIYFLDAQRDILSLMNICDIGVLSTYTEGISNAIMEFMALGKPVVATDGGGTNELLLDGETGYLVKRESTGELIEKINILLKNKLLCEKLGKNGQNRIKEEFNIEKMFEGFWHIYSKYL